MAEWFASGRIIDAILVLVAIEALVLLGWRALRGRGPSPALLLSNLASGAALMLAVRTALIGADWTKIAACLLLALLAHGTEMCLRLWKRDATDESARRSTVERKSAFRAGEGQGEGPNLSG